MSVEIRGLCKRYGGDAGREVLHDVSLRVAAWVRMRDARDRALGQLDGPEVRLHPNLTSAQTP